MTVLDINHCPGTLSKGFESYSQTALNRVFYGRKVSHILDYDSPLSGAESTVNFESNRSRISISGVQEKYSVILEKNKLRLTREGDKGTHILKPIPGFGKKRDQMPANENLTMQIARQVFGIETAENALIFFNNGEPAYITKRFDITDRGRKIAQDDFASLAKRTSYTHGAMYKYSGNYLELFELLKSYSPPYKTEALKLLTLILFNYLFSNGDAHYKNFSLLETPMGDHRLSPAYDLLNTRIHIEDSDFALSDGLLPRSQSQGKIKDQFAILAMEAGISTPIYQTLVDSMTSKSIAIEQLIAASFLNDNTKRSYYQTYLGRLKQLTKT